MMKKRLLALALAALMVLPLAACSEDKGPDTDLAYIQDKGTLVVGITDFAPMDYQDEEGQWIGFDADMARAFADHLGVEVRFEVVDWPSKHLNLQDKKIDLVWNGMTLTDEIRLQMDVSVPYCKNAQVVVLPANRVANYPTEDSLKGLVITAEDNSAGADALAHAGLTCFASDTQMDAIAQVASGGADACVIDQFMAATLTAPDAQYPDLAMGVELGDQAESIVVGFRKGSDLTGIFNQFWRDACTDGTVDDIAQRYNMSSFVLKTTP